MSYGLKQIFWNVAQFSLALVSAGSPASEGPRKKSVAVNSLNGRFVGPAFCMQDHVQCTG